MFLVLLILLFLPVAAVSIGLAGLPWRPMWLRFCVLAMHLVATVAAIVLLPGRFELWMMALGPGAAVALVRGFGALQGILGEQEDNGARGG